MIKRAIVTGATGAVGVALVDELVANGVEVDVICRTQSKRISNVTQRGANVVLCDLSGLDRLTLKGADAFFHLGWDGTLGKSRNDEKVQMKNIEYSLAAVRLAHRSGCTTFVGVGSQSEFGHSDSIKRPYDSCFPDNFYGAAKLSASYMTRTLCSQLGIKHIWCRIFSLFGAFDSDNTLIMSTIKKMLNGEKCQFTLGEQVWDYIYSKDAAAALYLAADKGNDQSIYCIASGQTRLLREYLKSLQAIVNPESEVDFGAIPYYEHQAMNLSCDISNLVKDTGWTPKLSFEEGIKDMLKTLKTS